MQDDTLQSNVAPARPVTEKVEALTKVKVRQFITLTITDREGAVCGWVSGEDGRGGALSLHLRDCAEANSPDVHKVLDSLTPLGQDTYVVDRQFIFETAHLMKHWENFKTLAPLIPLECRCTFLVSY